MQLKAILQRVPDPRGKQGQDYKLWSILGLIILSLLCGRRGMKAAFVLGRSLTRRHSISLFRRMATHPTFGLEALKDALESAGVEVFRKVEEDLAEEFNTR